MKRSSILRSGSETREARRRGRLAHLFFLVDALKIMKQDKGLLLSIMKGIPMSPLLEQGQK